MELRDYLKIIRRQFTVVVLVTLCVIAGYSVYFFYQEPTYSASSRIILQVPREWKQTPVFSMPNWNTRVSLIESSPVAKRTADQINSEGFDISPGQIQSGINTTTRENMDFIDISYQGRNPETVLAVLQTLPEIFLEYDRKNNINTLNSAKQNLSSNLSQAETKLQELESQLANYRRKHQIHSPDKQLNENLQKSYDINDKKLKLRYQKQELNKKIRSYRDRLRREGLEDDNISDEDFLALSKDSLQNLRSRLTSARLKLDELKNKYGPKHPERKALEKRIKTMEDDLRERVKRHIDNLPFEASQDLREKISKITLERNLLETRINLQEKRQQNIEKRLKTISRNQSQLFKLKRRLDLQEKRVQEARKNLNQVEYNLSLIGESGQIVSLPEKTNESYPADTETYGFVALVGIMLGISTGTFLEYLNDKIETKFDVKRYLNLPVLGTIPTVDPDTINLINSSLKTPLSEKYHTISVRLEHSLLQKSGQNTLLVTSSITGEGKSITATNLAVSLAREGDKVLLIDFDLRDPTIHKNFELMNSEGTSTFLSGAVQAEKELDTLKSGAEMTRSEVNEKTVDLIQKSTQVDNLDVIPSGPIPSNPIQQIKNDRSSKLLEITSKHYNIVLLDSPPLNSVVDPIILSKRTDASLLVLGSGMVSKGEVQHAKHLLDEVNVSILGTVLNNVSLAPEDYYSYYTQEDQ